MNITIAIGKYTPSYFHMLKEQGMNPTAGWTCRLADGQVDDTCFDVGVTFYELRDALKALTDHSDAEFNAVLSEAVIYAYQIKEGIVQNPFEPDKACSCEEFLEVVAPATSPTSTNAWERCGQALPYAGSF